MLTPLRFLSDWRCELCRESRPLRPDCCCVSDIAFGQGAGVVSLTVIGVSVRYPSVEENTKPLPTTSAGVGSFVEFYVLCSPRFLDVLTCNDCLNLLPNTLQEVRGAKVARPGLATVAELPPTDLVFNIAGFLIDYFNLSFSFGECCLAESFAYFGEVCLAKSLYCSI